MKKLIIFALLVIFCHQSTPQCRQKPAKNERDSDYFEQKLHTISRTSVCATGIWLLYPLANYNTGNFNTYMQFIFGPADSSVAHNLSSILRGNVASARFVGDPDDYRKDTLTLFEGPWFTGEEYLTKNMNAHLTRGQRPQSLIITGKSPWTIYSMPKFKGDYKCIGPLNNKTVNPNYGPYLIPNIVGNEVTSGIRSVRKGCFANLADFLNKLKPQN